MSVFILVQKTARTTIEANDLRAPGPPGSTDKVAPVIRGQRVAIATEPATLGQFIVTLRPTWQRLTR